MWLIVGIWVVVSLAVLVWVISVLLCPDCGSTIIHKYSDGEYECYLCGKCWYSEETREDGEDNGGRTREN